MHAHTSSPTVLRDAGLPRDVDRLARLRQPLGTASEMQGKPSLGIGEVDREKLLDAVHAGADGVAMYAEHGGGVDDGGFGIEVGP
jgi:thiamine monophosphate synthase